MATATTPNAKSGVAPRWAIVRHYIVLLSSDKDKKDTNRVWHDGKLAQHTYNGKLVLYDEANIEIADGFKSSLSTQLLPDGHEVTLGEYVIQVQTFERVSRTDLNLLGPATPVQQQRQQQQQQIPREQQQMGRHVGAHTPSGIVRGGQVATEQGRSPAQVSPATNTASASTTSSSSSSSAASTTAGPTRTLPGNSTPRRGPKSTHTFRTPFKRVSGQASLPEGHDDGVSSPSTTTAAKVVAGDTDTEERSEGEARGKKRRVDTRDGRDGQKDADVR